MGIKIHQPRVRVYVKSYLLCNRPRTSLQFIGDYPGPNLRSLHRGSLAGWGWFRAWFGPESGTL